MFKIPEKDWRPAKMRGLYKKEMSTKDLVLALETGIGGSVSLFRDGRTRTLLGGDSSEFKADQILEKLSGLLKKNGLEKESIREIRYSVNPGSHTGLQIGEALARGLRISMGTRSVGRDLFECIFSSASSEKGLKIVFLPAGREGLVWAISEKDGGITDTGTLRFGSKDVPEDRIRFDGYLNREDDPVILAPFKMIYESARKDDFGKMLRRGRSIDLGENLSVYVGMF